MPGPVGEIGEDTPDHGHELESVPGEASADDDSTFTIDQPEVRSKEARDRALATAQARANEYAAKAGARAVRLLSITEGAQGRSYGNDIVVTASRMSTMDVAAPPPPPSPVQPGEIVTSVSMFVQYALER